jgi:DNA-binding XRE family transcriptional regulator
MVGVTEHALTRYRRTHRLSLDAFAALVDASKATISRLEARIQDPSFDLVRRIIAATDGEVTADDFVPRAPPQTVRPDCPA